MNKNAYNQIIQAPIYLHNRRKGSNNKKIWFETSFKRINLIPELKGPIMWNLQLNTGEKTTLGNIKRGGCNNAILSQSPRERQYIAVNRNGQTSNWIGNPFKSRLSPYLNDTMNKIPDNIIETSLSIKSVSIPLLFRTRFVCILQSRTPKWTLQRGQL